MRVVIAIILLVTMSTVVHRLDTIISILQKQGEKNGPIQSPQRGPDRV